MSRSSSSLVRRVDQSRGEEWGAIYSTCERYRYLLWRRWDKSRPGMVAIGLNPSTATELQNDPTITRLIGFARDRGYGAMVMLNAFAYRSTDPANLRKEADPVGEENDRFIKRETRKGLKEGGIVVCAWGNHGLYLERSAAVRAALPTTGEIVCFGLTGQNEPKHPLYLPKSAPFVAMKL